MRPARIRDRKMGRTKEDIEKDIEWHEFRIKKKYDEFAEYERRYLREKIGDRTTKVRLYNEWKGVAEYGKEEIEKLKEELRALKNGLETHRKLIEQRQLEKFRDKIRFYKEVIAGHRREWLDWYNKKNTSRADLSWESMKRYRNELFEYLNNAPEGFCLLEKASALESCDRENEAIACYDKYLEAHPNKIDGVVGKVNILKLRDKYNEAIACYDKYLEKNPNNIECLEGKVEILYLQRKYKEVITYCDKVLELKPSIWTEKGVEDYKKKAMNELSNRSIEKTTWCYLGIFLLLSLVWGNFLLNNVISLSWFYSLLLLYAPFWIAIITTVIILKKKTDTVVHIMIICGVIYSIIATIMLSDGFWSFIGNLIACLAMALVILIIAAVISPNKDK